MRLRTRGKRAIFRNSDAGIPTITPVLPASAAPAFDLTEGVYNRYAPYIFGHFVTKLTLGAQPDGCAVFDRQRLSI
jgi:hypothetical protein